jgi:DNA ligase D-like protein (predicted 3'-phosphoesterase)
MTLKAYRKKRRFGKTPEPTGAAPKIGHDQKTGLRYVIQRHQASHLHWDLRLEEKGVLKSWAIPKEPPVEQGTRRLAINVEDHPLEYADFHGGIPKGEYGAGTVEIWDRGSYLPIETTPVRRIFEIKGRKLRGRYCLIKLKAKDPKDKNWLFLQLNASGMKGKTPKA